MAALQCEICGGKLQGKPGGVFECDSCGMEYSTEWAKAKIQEIKGTVKVEGTVQVEGTVKLDGPVEVKGGGPTKESLLKRAWIELESYPTVRLEQRKKRKEEILGYFDRVLDIDPECAEAYLGKVCLERGIADYHKLGRYYYLDGTIGYNKNFTENESYCKARQFASEEITRELDALEAELDIKIQEQTLRNAEAERLEQERQAQEERLAQERIEQEEASRKEEARRRKALWDSMGAERTKIIPYARKLLHATGNRTWCLNTDGTVYAAGNNDDGQLDVRDWQDIVAFSTNGNTVAGLRSDGTVVAVGFNATGMCNVSEWKDITDISVGGFVTVGLKKDGSVVATKWTGNPKYYAGAGDVNGWRNVVAIEVGYHHTVGLRNDGTILLTGYNRDSNIRIDVSGWRGITAISVGNDHVVGLKADGSVVAAGSNVIGQCNVGSWKDIASIYADGNYTIGLRSDGTVVATGNNQFGQCNVDGWTDIVAISTSGIHTVGLKSDGTAISTKLYTGGMVYEDVGQCDVGDWTDMMAVSASIYNTIGLRLDGTVVSTKYTGKFNYGQCNVEQWKLFENAEAYINRICAMEAKKAQEHAAKAARFAALQEKESAINALKAQRSRLGLFDGKQKKEIDAQIAALEAQIRSM